MKQVFILNEERYEVTVKQERGSQALLSIPRVGELAPRLIPASGVRIELDAATDDGKKLQGVFRVVGRREDGATEIEPWSDMHELGSR